MPSIALREECSIVFVVVDNWKQIIHNINFTFSANAKGFKTKI